MPLELGNLLGKPATKRKHRPNSVFPLPYCLMGPEVEVEGVNRRPPTSLNTHWLTKADHSLRGNSAEFVAAEPMFGEDLYSALEMICEIGRSENWEVNYRTSEHIHMDARDLEFPAFKALLCTYAVLEPLIYDWIGDKRQDSVFCLPWYSAEGDIDLIRQMILNPDSLAHGAKSIHRYSGLNLNALDKFGSIEFRHLRTTFDLPRVVDWICMIQSIKAFAIEEGKTGKNIGISLVNKITKQGVEPFVVKVFGQNLASKLLSTFTGNNMDTSLLIFNDLIKQDFQKGMFVPATSFLVPGKNKSFEAYTRKNKKIKAKVPKNIINYNPPNYYRTWLGIGNDPLRRVHTYHGMVPHPTHRNVFVAYDPSRAEYIPGNDVHASYACDLDTTELTFEEVNRSLAAIWAGWMRNGWRGLEETIMVGGYMSNPANLELFGNPWENQESEPAVNEEFLDIESER